MSGRSLLDAQTSRQLYYSLLWTWILLPLTVSGPEPRILVVGGSGRVGGSATRALVQRFPLSRIDVAGRNRATWEQCRARWRLDDSVGFVPLDISRESDVRRVVAEYDVVVHTAGPFQGNRDPKLLRQSLSLGRKYIDVCDDVPLSAICRSQEFQDLARRNGGRAVISTGIWPGGSSLLAQQVIRSDVVGGHANVDRVNFSFFTAGSGGAGPTILTATFLILGEDVITYVNGQQVLKKSATDPRVVNFGKSIGSREVVRLSLIECESCHLSGVKTVETFFGTAPPIWNTLFAVMAQVVPQSWLQNRQLMADLALFSLPMVRLIDSFVGAANGMSFRVFYASFYLLCIYRDSCRRDDKGRSRRHRSHDT